MDIHPKASAKFKALIALGGTVLGRSIEGFYIKVAAVKSAYGHPPDIYPAVAEIFAKVEFEKQCINATTEDLAAWLDLPQASREAVRRALNPLHMRAAPCPCRVTALQTDTWTICTLCRSAWPVCTISDRTVIFDARALLGLSAAELTQMRSDGEEVLPCTYCNESMPRKMLTRDHVLPKKVRGSGGHSPIVLACARCNGKKGEMSAVNFKAWLATAKGINWLASRGRPRAPWK